MPALPGFALTVAITQQDPAIHARPDDTSSLGTLDYVDTASVAVEGPFDTYWAARGKNLRQNVRKQLAKVEQDGIVPQLDCVTDPQGVAAAIEQYGRLESAGWKAQGGTAIGADNAQGRFYRRVFEAFCARGAGRIYRYWFGDRVVAMDLCVLDGPVLVVLKTTYDESLRTVSPASLLRYGYFRALFDEGVIRRIEFYGKVMDWHLRWTSDIRTLYHLNAYRWRWVKRLHTALSG
jgi:CelD/BcsL family acetyltransferase involved in cellulose biosynthesis